MSAQRHKRPGRKWSKHLTYEVQDLNQNLEHWKERALLAEDMVKLLTDNSKKHKVNLFMVYLLGVVGLVLGYILGVIL